MFGNNSGCLGVELGNWNLSFVLSEKDLNDCKEGNLIWVDNDKIFDLNMWEGDRLFLNWAKTGNIFSAKIVYDNGKLKDYNVSFLD